jgi:hypothetical protein
MTKTELAKAAAELGLDVPKGATAADIEKLIEAATAADDETAADDVVEVEGDVSPGTDEAAVAEPAAVEMVTYVDEVASLVAVVTADCATPFDNTFLTLKAGQEVEGLLASQLVAAGLAEPKD